MNLYQANPSIYTDLSEDAVEHDELDIFLRRNENSDPLLDGPMPEVKPVGVPGAMTPLEMTPERLRKKIIAGSPASSPLKGKKSIPVNKRRDEIDMGDDLGDHGLQGVKVTRDELRALVEELGLAGDDAGDLVRSLTTLSISDKDATSEDPQPKNPGHEARDAGPVPKIESVVQDIPDKKADDEGDKSDFRGSDAHGENK